MKLSVTNLGRIRGAELELRPLTVFCGKNGTNKTWTAYAAYGLIRELVSEPLWRFSPGPDIETGLAAWTEEQSRFLSGVLSDASRDAATGTIATSIPLPEGEEAGTPVRIRGGAKLIAELLRGDSQEWDGCSFALEASRVLGSAVAIDVSFDLGKGLARVTLARDGSSASSTLRMSAIRNGDAPRFIAEALAQLLSSVARRAVALPAERKALAMGDPASRLEWSRWLPLPASDYAEFLRNVPGARWSETTGLENLFGGSLVEVVPGESPTHLRLPAGKTLPLTAVSALVRANLGLALAVMRDFGSGDVLVIDELEMNAHPEAQLLLTEIVAALVNRGAHVILTTHSPYIVEHVNNLVLAGRLDSAAQAEVAPAFESKSSDCFLTADKVAAYLFEEVGDAVEVRDIFDREEGVIDWRTFSAISDRLAALESLLLTKVGP